MFRVNLQPWLNIWNVFVWQQCLEIIWLPDFLIKLPLIATWSVLWNDVTCERSCLGQFCVNSFDTKTRISWANWVDATHGFWWPGAMPWYWVCIINRSLPFTGNGFNYLCHLGSEKIIENANIISCFLKNKLSMARVKYSTCITENLVMCHGVLTFGP